VTLAVLEGTLLSSPTLRFHPAIPSKTHSHAFKGLLAHGPFDSSGVSLGPSSVLLMFPRQHQPLAQRLEAALTQGHKLYPGFSKLFRVDVSPAAFSPFSFDVTDQSPLGDQYRGAVERWNASRAGELPELALVLVPHSERWETEQPYYQAKAALARLGIPSQMVTTELMMDQGQFDWSVANIALAAFAKLGGIPWLVGAPTQASDLVIGVGRADIRTSNGGMRIFGYAVSFVANGLYRHTWSFTPAADEETYSSRLEAAITAALQEDLDADQPAERIVIHLGKKTGWREIEAASRALAAVDSKAKTGFLRIDDTTIYDLANTKEDTLAPTKGLAVQLGERRYLLQAEGLTPTGAPEGPLLLELDERSQVTAPDLPYLVEQAFHLAHANWRGFNARSEPAPLAYGELLARLVGYMEMVATWDPRLLRSDLQSRPWFL
jgi:hypothetical protein